MRTPGLVKRARLGLQRDEQTGQALEGLLHIQHAFCDGSCGGGKIAESPGGAVPAMVRGQACKGLVPESLRRPGPSEGAKLAKCDGEDQPLGLTNLQSQAKWFFVFGEEQPVVLSNLQSQAS